MVGNALGVVGAVHQQGNEFRLRLGKLFAGDLHEIGGDVGLHGVDALLGGG